MMKHIDMLTQVPEKKNIYLHGGASKKDGGSSFEDKEKVHALGARTIRYLSFIIDFRDSRHMISIKESFSSLDYSKGENILLGDNSETKSKGKGRINFDHGSFNNYLYAPGITFNLLSLYQMSHTGSPKKVVFSPN